MGQRLTFAEESLEHFQNGCISGVGRHEGKTE
jgi:hypothetical protein